MGGECREWVPSRRQLGVRAAAGALEVTESWSRRDCDYSLMPVVTTRWAHIGPRTLPPHLACFFPLPNKVCQGDRRLSLFLVLWQVLFTALVDLGHIFLFLLWSRFLNELCFHPLALCLPGAVWESSSPFLSDLGASRKHGPITVSPLQTGLAPGPESGI